MVRLWIWAQMKGHVQTTLRSLGLTDSLGRRAG